MSRLDLTSLLGQNRLPSHQNRFQVRDNFFQRLSGMAQGQELMDETKNTYLEEQAYQNHHKNPNIPKSSIITNDNIGSFGILMGFHMNKEVCASRVQLSSSVPSLVSFATWATDSKWGYPAN